MKLSNFVPALKAFDWARIVAWALVFVLWTGAAYFKGRDDEQDKQLRAQIEQSEQISKAVMDYSRVVAEKETKAAEQNARLREGGKKYEEAVNKNPRPDSCDLTPDELRAFQELVKG